MSGERPEHLREAPGRPGAPPRWSGGSKAAGGTSRSDASLVWFTIGRGVLNEVYHPRVDCPCTRDLYLMVTGPGGYFSDEREDADHRVEWIEDGVPAFRVATECRRGRYRIEKTIVTDDRLNVVLQRTRFIDLAGGLRAFAYASPHVGGEGGRNTAWVGEFKGRIVLFAGRGDLALALMCSHGFVAASVGFAGKSDGPDDLRENGRLTRSYTRAAEGNIGLIGEVDLSAGHEFTIALGFGMGSADAAHHALGGLLQDFDDRLETYAARWREWQAELLPPGPTRGGRDLYRVSTATLLSHTNKSIPGAVASLAIPWGDHRGDDDLMQGAYHLVWSRDLVQHGTGLLAAGARPEVRRLLDYLRATQEPDGHWPQNMWVSGETFWDGIQVDQAAQPILLSDLALREGAIREDDRSAFWPMIRAAAGYMVRYGAATELDRWEEEKGYNAFTLATMVASALAAADWAEAAGERATATYLRETADSWDACIEGWLYVRGTKLAREVGVDGYYARILPPSLVEPTPPGRPEAILRGEEDGEQTLPAPEVVSLDALALVRFGLRAADDPQILSTLKAIDATLRIETERGPIWHRYIADRFGEKDDGSPFSPNDKGRGRAWPLLIGERAHYELASGDRREAEGLLQTMANYANEAGMIPEQVWDSAKVPEKGLFRGRPTGSACPLLWAHAEYLKLRRSLKDGRVFDRPPQAAERYRGGRRGDAKAVWRVEHPLRSVPAGTSLRIEATDDAEISWKARDGASGKLPAGPTFLGVRVADLTPEVLPRGVELHIVVIQREGSGREEYTVEVQ